jgi:DNA (cytosine-5)-methyltransferase 1
MEPPTRCNEITFADLFAGIGGFRLGIENAAKRLGIPVKCVFSCEIEINARFIYEKNFKEVPSGDITKIQANDVPDVDILCGGFPCQDVSVAGKQSGFRGCRTSLFFELIRIAKEKQPKIILLENVKGLLQSNRGWDFARVLFALDDIGYEFFEWDCIDTAHYLPQRRERVFIIGHLRGSRTGKIFPLQREARTIYEKPEKPEAYSVYDPRRINKKCNGRLIKGNGEPSFTLTKQDRHAVLVNSRIRFLTPVEYERLQGFPDNWTEGIEDKYRYECLGNAVTVPVIEAIAERILKGFYNV